VSDISEIPFNQEVVRSVYEQAQGQPTSVVVSVTNEPEWITRGGTTVAYRVPQNEELKSILKATGPLIAPSANPEGLPPARTLEEAREYFGEQVDLYVDGGEVPLDTMPSHIIALDEKGIGERLR
jgi:L-threonylcarbamoyladenylate synthase